MSEQTGPADRVVTYGEWHADARAAVIAAIDGIMRDAAPGNLHERVADAAISATLGVADWLLIQEYEMPLDIPQAHQDRYHAHAALALWQEALKVGALPMGKPTMRRTSPLDAPMVGYEMALLCRPAGGNMPASVFAARPAPIPVTAVREDGPPGG